jgi:hypothetical protein
MALVSYQNVNLSKALHLSACVLLFFDLVSVCPAILMLHLLVIMPVAITEVMMMRWMMDFRHHQGTHHLINLMLDDVSVAPGVRAQASITVSSS